jgi:hypothetical protein
MDQTSDRARYKEVARSRLINATQEAAVTPEQEKQVLEDIKNLPRINVVLSAPAIYWHPQPDISVYELSCCIAVMFVATQGCMDLAEYVADLPPEARRHFSAKDGRAALGGER